MSEEFKRPTSIQVNVRMPPEWVRDFKELAQKVAGRTGKKHTAQDMMREAMVKGFYHVERRYGIG